MAQTNCNEINWQESYPQLHMQARRIVHNMQVAHWQGQEEDVAWDIVQESMRRAVEYVRKTEKGEQRPLESPIGLLTIVAKNYGKDLRRREWRLSKEAANTPQEFVDNETSFSEVAVENVYRECLFRTLAHEIAHFPPKQRLVLLADLAGRMAFSEQPSALQAAFQAEGIRLEEYRRNKPQGANERSRNAALLTHAYKRLKALKEVQEYLTLN
jgi:DNA-directed RNA polymerase specialized sigma24 family protein